jgi:hypothetical protein
MTTDHSQLTTDNCPAALTPSIRSSLGELRGRIHRYVWAQGLASGLSWLAAAFWLDLAADWFFEPPLPVRAVLLAVVGLVFAGLLLQRIGRRIRVPLSDANMAMLLERRFPEFQESLLTTVELAGQDLDGDPWTAQMLDHTRRLADQRIGSVELRKVFDPRPLRWATLVALLLWGAAAGFAMGAPGTLRVWWHRAVLLRDELWPRRTHLVVEGFDRGPLKIARGSDLEIIVKADLRMPLVPQVVQVRYWPEGGSALRAAMTRLGIARPGHDAFQEYSYTFRNVLVRHAFDVFGGDDAVRNLQIEVVDSPTIVAMVLDCHFPAYTHFAPRQIPVSGTMPLPQGTRVVVRAKANKDLARVEIDSALDEQPAAPRVIELAKAADRRSFQYPLESLNKDQTLLFTLVDSDGIRTREPVRLSLAAVPDEPPRLMLQLQGIGAAVTPKARLPVSGRITDDYGVARLWFEYALDKQPPAQQPLPLPPVAPIELSFAEALDLRGLGLAAGHKLQLGVKAADGYNLAGGPNIGASERWVLDVVTPEQLRAMLEGRELVLRQRFEAIIQEVVETRDLLDRVEFGLPGGKAGGAKGGGAKAPGARPATAEPGDDAQGTPGGGPERAVALRGLRVERASQNSRKNAQETLGVAEAFDEIRQQLVNNRIDTEELIRRVKGGIADPLRQIAGDQFPELDRRLEQLRTTLEDEKLGPANRRQARQQTDVIVLAMRQVLARMVELESFNEAVELLRSIIQQQERLDERTRQRHKQKLRDLLEQ